VTGYEKPKVRRLVNFVNNTGEPYHSLLQEIKTAQAIDALATNVKFRIVGIPIVDIPYLQRIYQLEEDSSNE
jgi:hypothetical protein